ncbi:MULTISPECIES: TetR/AcrR family transcriptional regulator [unclassified Streptomyces]|uniref:TetR/AcrR family transcriptional regulator n=1 Tax=unclassified Streptomyces TaxID=2593676 RepID=UPI00202EA982|nr:MULTISPECIES: TetR/AcrR family transcriptional regulator [unclassified Streptomyces]MCM1974916.1 TetR/AcrR family transcriptional regulator [Streptomyces sp. G1]MCX5122586.1 TetR/AcrR family transcriptional regulator [Streptomyces sp. NBC_00347]MCX5295942.1 TetR/AcrR family transcriptional regulator [Streptomyces sp. NBC_00193]
MPTARESLLEAAGAALAARPWPAVRMIDVAAAAGVSRQTLYNEFAGKTGLGHALVRRDAAWYLDGVDRALSSPGPSGDRTSAERLAAVVEWTVRAGRERALVRALLTGCWNGNLPVPAGRGVRPGLPALGPAELIREVRERAHAAFGAQEGAQRCELAVRLALSYLVAPAEPPGAGRAGLLGLLSGTSPRAGAR